MHVRRGMTRLEERRGRGRGNRGGIVGDLSSTRDLGGMAEVLSQKRFCLDVLGLVGGFGLNAMF